jgi:hypothetical protein
MMSANTITALPATAKQIAYARKIATRNHIVLPWAVQLDRQKISAWIKKHAVQNNHDSSLPTSKQVGFAERIARIKRRDVPDECYRSRELLSRWIDCNQL